MNSKEPYFLVINLGLRSIRAIVFNSQGEKLIHSWYPVRTILKGHHVEQDPREWWQRCQEVVSEALVNEEIRGKIAALTVTSSASCLVCLDKNGEPVGNVIMVSDKRAEKEANLLRTDPRFAEITKDPQKHTVPSFMMPKIMWLAKNQPEEFQKTEKFVSSNDYLLYKLSGEYATDPLNAEKFYFDQKIKKYPESILTYLNISEKKLSPVRKVGEVIGTLRPELVQKWHLPNNVKVILSTYDALCAFWGTGVSEEGDACNVCGTVTSFRVYSKKHSQSEKGILSQCFDDNQGTYIIGGSNNLDGGLLEWAKGVFYGDAYPEKYIFNIMEDEASQSQIGSQGLIFLPYLLGERVPFFDSNVRGMFFGLERHHARRDLMRSIFESSAFLAMSIMEAIESLDVPVKNIRLSGGLVRNNLIAKIRADVTGRDVLLVEEMETTALGAFMIMAISQGLFHGFKSASSIVKIKKVYSPDPEAHEKYQHIYNLFKELYRDTGNSFLKRVELLKKIHKDDSHHVIDNL